MSKAALIPKLKERFNQNASRHPDLIWSKVEDALSNNAGLLCAVTAMEESGGEPDVLKFSSLSGKYYFVDFSAESPAERRSLCYDEAALESRKKHKPSGSAMGWAEKTGTRLLTPDAYIELQEQGVFDSKTSSWLATPSDIRKAGGALFGDWRFGRVFVYHNGAESYYAARGFRVCVALS